MTEKESLTELTRITEAKDEWPERVAFVESFLDAESVKLRAKAVWLYGEMGLKHPELVRSGVPVVAALFDDSEPLLRLPQCVLPYLDKLRCLSETDPNRVVRIHSQGAIRITEKAAAGRNK